MLHSVIHEMGLGLFAGTWYLPFHPTPTHQETLIETAKNPSRGLVIFFALAAWKGAPSRSPPQYELHLHRNPHLTVRFPAVLHYLKVVRLPRILVTEAKKSGNAT